MKLHIAFAVVVISTSCTLHAQDNPPSSVTSEQKDAVSDERAAKIRALAEIGRKRQEALNKHNFDVMARWTYAVCIGCGPQTKKVRLLHTYPLRVLAGIQAADDDAAERAGRPPT